MQKNINIILNQDVFGSKNENSFLITTVVFSPVLHCNFLSWIIEFPWLLPRKSPNNPGIAREIWHKWLIFIAICRVTNPNKWSLVWHGNKNCLFMGLFGKSGEHIRDRENILIISGLFEYMGMPHLRYCWIWCNGGRKSGILWDTARTSKPTNNNVI